MTHLGTKSVFHFIVENRKLLYFLFSLSGFNLCNFIHLFLCNLNNSMMVFWTQNGVLRTILPTAFHPSSNQINIPNPFTSSRWKLISMLTDIPWKYRVKWSEVAQLCRLLAILWTVAHQAPPSMGFSRQEYCSGLPFPNPGLPHCRQTL